MNGFENELKVASTNQSGELNIISPHLIPLLEYFIILPICLSQFRSYSDKLSP
jgi:hypothetical protein